MTVAGRTLPGLLEDAARSSPDREVVFPGERATWPRIDERTRALAGGLHRRGVTRGDRVMIVLAGGLDAVVTLIAATRIGAIPAPVNPRSTAVEIEYLRSDARPAVVVASPDLTTLAGPGAVTPAELDDGGVAPPDVEVEADDPMILLYTSGTTARPRGCVHTHGAYTALGANLVERLRLTPADRFWTPLPLFHCGGIDVLVGSVAARCTFVHVGTFTADAAWRQLVDERASVAFPAFDTIWLPVLDHPGFAPADVPRLRTVINVGTPERMAAMQARLPSAIQVSCLGGTESGGFCCVGSVDDPPAARAGTSGRPLTGMEATVRDPETGRECCAGEPGEFRYRGVSRMSYYHGDPATTAERIDDDGWFHTGDLVRRDEQGRYTFVSRLKDMIKVGGENVAAAEVEGRLAEHPAVGVVAVVGAPDARLGEVAAAYVQLAPGRTATPDELREHCRAAMATFKVPRYVELVDAFPMSGTKIQKGVLRDRIVADLARRGITEAPRLPRQGTHRLPNGR